jgi:hypothetical protein
MNESPLRLQGWSVVDAQGRETRIDLFDLVTGIAMQPELFNTQIADQ